MFCFNCFNCFETLSLEIGQCCVTSNFSDIHFIVTHKLKGKTKTLGQEKTEPEKN